MRIYSLIEPQAYVYTVGQYIRLHTVYPVSLEDHIYIKSRKEFFRVEEKLGKNLYDVILVESMFLGGYPIDKTSYGYKSSTSQRYTFEKFISKGFLMEIAESPLGAVHITEPLLETKYGYDIPDGILFDRTKDSIGYIHMNASKRLAMCIDVHPTRICMGHISCSECPIRIKCEMQGRRFL